MMYSAGTDKDNGSRRDSYWIDHPKEHRTTCQEGNWIEEIEEEGEDDDELWISLKSYGGTSDS